MSFSDAFCCSNFEDEISLRGKIVIARPRLCNLYYPGAGEITKLPLSVGLKFYPWAKFQRPKSYGFWTNGVIFLVFGNPI